VSPASHPFRGETGVDFLRDDEERSDEKERKGNYTKSEFSVLTPEQGGAEGARRVKFSLCRAERPPSAQRPEASRKSRRRLLRPPGEVSPAAVRPQKGAAGRGGAERVGVWLSEGT
jgi:hypothetical protein